MSDKLRILIISDNESMLQTLRNIVRHHAKLKPDFVAGGSQALPMITSGEPYHLIISDISKAGVSTGDVLRMAISRDAGTRVVVVSSFGEQQEVIEASNPVCTVTCTSPFARKS